MKKNADRLRQLMKKHDLTRKRVAELARRGVSTVDTWLAPATAKSYHPMPDNALALIELELGEATSGKTSEPPSAS